MPADLNPADRVFADAFETFMSAYRSRYMTVNGIRSNAPLRDEVRDLNAAFAALSAARADGPGGGAIEVLRDLAALVRGECPSLLNEDSGGDAALDQRIDDAPSPVMVEGGLGKSGADIAPAAFSGPVTTAEQAGWRDFNINEKVRVRLTDAGQRILRDNHDRVFAGSTSTWAKYRPPKADADGWVEMQAWSVMQDFGPHIRMGRDVPFETTIQVHFPAPPASVISPPTAADAMSAPDTKPLSPQTGEEAETITLQQQEPDRG